MPSNSIDCVVTSPPYFGLRDYGEDGQIGVEQTVAEYVDRVVEVFDEVRRVLADHGTAWINVGDSYARRLDHAEGIRPKGLVGVPWRLAIALQKTGWTIRQEIQWHKPNAMPESVTDRFSRDHETVFLLVKKGSYYFDEIASREPVRSTRAASRKAKRTGAGHAALRPCGTPYNGNGDTRRIRTVWSIATRPFRGAHFATFPEDLPARCIEIGCCPNGVVLDPFAGAGTTLLAASRLHRNSIGVELNAEYAAIAADRLFGNCEVETIDLSAEIEKQSPPADLSQPGGAQEGADE